MILPSLRGLEQEDRLDCVREPETSRGWSLLPSIRMGYSRQRWIQALKGLFSCFEGCFGERALRFSHCSNATMHQLAQLMNIKPWSWQILYQDNWQLLLLLIPYFSCVQLRESTIVVLNLHFVENHASTLPRISSRAYRKATRRRYERLHEGVSCKDEKWIS